jgi:hypothetical protein
MGCQPTKCKECGGSFPACALKDGLCAYCRDKQKNKNDNPKTY